MSSATVAAQLAELRLVFASLLPDESLNFADGAEEWRAFVEDDGDNATATLTVLPSFSSPTTDCRFEVKVRNAPMWLEIELPRLYPTGTSALVSVKVNDDVERREQEKWQAIVKELLSDSCVGREEHPILELLSIVLPQIRDFHETHTVKAQAQAAQASPSESASKPKTPVIHHALFTSHHLISSDKRRSMQKWASDLSLQGFAKVGYPGAIYCEGEEENVEEFVSNVKAMQWLNLHLWFAEPVPNHLLQPEGLGASKAWTELERVGDVLRYMQKLGREEFVLDVGLGSGRNNNANS
ncbi:DUF1115-domain-containing protein [Schizopora paradoxa]|uniref:DUF1115-domain-containing protein n=1 Tax=Schizopora paradoxa TaxID=27342 RepID=A0A0H2S7A9_9AGAM|nr:DUF1115-domain-containing protein [Schizopora paradoxa]